MAFRNKIQGVLEQKEENSDWSVATKACISLKSALSHASLLNIM